MYCLTDRQIDYILDDIRRNGVELEDLQYNLLDHICCIVEQNLKEGDDFEDFYHKTVQQFYTKELREIEEETIRLLTFKNYYAMKKAMLVSGAISVSAFIVGAMLKLGHLPGASILLFLGMIVLSLVFLPLMCILKIREVTAMRNKLILFLGTFIGILYCMSALFKVMHWPGANVMWYSTLIISFFGFIPIYLFTGIRHPETRVNTIVSTILLVALLGIQFMMTALRPAAQGDLYTYLQSEQLLKQRQAMPATTANSETRLADAINHNCERLKSLVLKHSSALRNVPADFEERHINIGKTRLDQDFWVKGNGYEALTALKASVDKYNAQSSPANSIPINNSILNEEFMYRDFCTDLFVLSSLTQIQLYLAGNGQPPIAKAN